MIIIEVKEIWPGKLCFGVSEDQRVFCVAEGEGYVDVSAIGWMWRNELILRWTGTKNAKLNDQPTRYFKGVMMTMQGWGGSDGNVYQEIP